ncbi:Hypothetical predicted protein [Octopus vulgaris]|uniref:Uncharacterized protein n=1 Tax=Octopus vulgaris TaxID=6645 RepID=A0AA36BT65_OCTVU|nr:Hypothetical predicted protein [Octopus vulgaris]
MKTPKMTSKENDSFCEPAIPSYRRRFSLSSAASIMDLTELTFKRKRKKDDDSISIHSLDTSSFKYYYCHHFTFLNIGDADGGAAAALVVLLIFFHTT